MTAIAFCSICHNRCISQPDGHCGRCRKAADRLPEPDRYSDEDLELTGGEWVNDRGIMRWRERQAAT